jgi:capsular exopolysaccharide synthesis family protein
MKILDSHKAKTPSSEPAPPTGAPSFEEIGRVSAQHVDAVPAAVTNTSSEAAEEFRLLRAKIRALDEERPLRCFGLVSAGAGEGKTTMALGLATALAQEAGRRVLLVDCDLRRPAVEQYLGLSRAAGLSEWLEGRTSSVALRRVEPQGFFVVSHGHSNHHRPELLGSDRMARFLERARETFDFVILDCAPLVSVADSVILQELVDGFLLVVRARHSPRDTVLKALSHLKPDVVRGAVFNDHKDVLPGYKHYGYRYR